jgi:hypothetical protein
MALKGEERGAMSDGGKPASAEGLDEADAAVAVDTGANNWPDEAAETAFRAEARERGETVQPSVAAVDAAEETDAKGLPALEDLLKRIPPAAREALDEHFRARFTGVKRVPAKALKG